jgi:hypothetical protein
MATVKLLGEPNCNEFQLYANKYDYHKHPPVRLAGRDHLIGGVLTALKIVHVLARQ